MPNQLHSKKNVNKANVNKELEYEYPIICVKCKELKELEEEICVTYYPIFIYAIEFVNQYWLKELFYNELFFLVIIF